MCACDPRVRTPFCGKPGCHWPKPAQVAVVGETVASAWDAAGLTDAEQKGVVLMGPNAGWVRQNYRAEMNDDEARCVETLCTLAAPYNLPFPAGNAGWQKNVVWLHGRGLAADLFCTIATTDFNELTRLVVAAHRHLVRVQISGKAKGRVQIMLHARQAEGRSNERHPDLDDLLGMFFPSEVKP